MASKMDDRLTSSILWPRKTREMHNHHMDSTIWNDFEFRNDDIIIATYGKSGTTWTQQIVAQLVTGGDENLIVGDESPWLDLRVQPKAEKLAAIEAQTHRRFIKTHLPVDALVFSPRAKYLYIGRDGRDVAWSLYNHLFYGTDTYYNMINETPGRVGPPMQRPPASVHQYFIDWFEKDGYPIWPFWENVRSWWEIRSLPNVLLLHFADLKANLEHEVRRIAAFLDIAVEESRWPDILDHCKFDYMKANASKYITAGDELWEGGPKTFINKGTNGRWRDVLTEAESRRYEERAVRELGTACARWLARGSAPTGS